MRRQFNALINQMAKTEYGTLLKSRAQYLKWLTFVKVPNYLRPRFENLLGIKGINRGLKQWLRKRRIRVTIIIPTYNDVNLTKKCLVTILNDTFKPPNLRIIIVDDGSKVEIQENLKKLRRKNVEIFLKQKNEGYSSAINFALSDTKNSDIVIMNNDIKATPGWLGQLQLCAYSNKNYGIVGPKLLYPDGRIQFAGGHRNKGAPIWFDHIYRFQNSNYLPANLEREVFYITGACMYIKQNVLKRVGKFDKNFGMGFEDVDYCLRVRSNGYEIIYCPKATLTHYESATRGRDLKEYEKKSILHFWSKWGKYLNERDVYFDKKEGKLNIVYVLQDTGVGGGHRDVFEHINRLFAAGHNVKLFALARQPNWFKLNIRVKTFKNYHSLEKVLSKVKAIKVATWWETAESVWRSSLKNGIPVYLVQDIEDSYYRNDRSEAVRVLASYRDEFNYITISNSNKNRLRDLNLNADIIAPGIDTEVFSPNPKLERKGNVILTIGRRHYLKNLQLTVSAWRKIREKVELWMFGIDPNIYFDLKAEYSNAKLKYFIKPTDQQIADLYRQATAYVQTSIHEGFCLPILEAMACGCVVITTDADGNMDFCIDKKNCILVDKTNPKKLSKIIMKTLQDQNLQNKLRKEGLKVAQAYDWKKKIKKLEDYYLKLAERGYYGINTDSNFSIPSSILH